ncbi:hypothetical protein V3C99_001620 [Haemonchus contortus]
MTSSLLFELVGLYNSVLYDNSPDSFQLSSRLFTSKVSRNLNWFGPLWKLNPASVVAQLAGKVLVSISGVCGRSVSAYVSGVFHETPWCYGIISLLLTICIMVIGLFIVARYQIHVGIRGFTLSRQWSQPSIPGIAPRGYGTETS